MLADITGVMSSEDSVILAPVASVKLPREPTSPLSPFGPGADTVTVDTSVPVTATVVPVLLLVTLTEFLDSAIVIVLLDVVTVVDIIKLLYFYLILYYLGVI